MAAWKWLVLGCFIGAGLHAQVLGTDGSIVDVWPAGSVLAAPRHVRRLPDFTQLVERVGPAVVNVTTRALHSKASIGVAERHYDVYKGLSEEGAGVRGGALLSIGSGFIVHADGHILTNAHVVAGADEVYVKLTGQRREIRAQVVGIDKNTDIALLKIDARRLPAVACGSSHSLKVGDWVAAIGSPFGFDNTITVGIVSAKERRLPEGTQSFLQSDVAINPGSSGGPLVNLNGEVVGINSKMYTRTGGYMGVSFAIPIETAIAVGRALRTRAAPGI